MAFAHRLDPPVQTEAAKSFGKLVAQGICEEADCVPLLLEAALRTGYQGDVRGLQSRLTWHVHDSAWQWGITRRETERAIKREIAPLIAEWAGANEILGAADAVNVARGEPLLWREVKDVVAVEMAWALRRNRTRGRQHVR